MDLLALLFPREKKFYKMLEEQVELVSEAVESFHTLLLHYHKLTPRKRAMLSLLIQEKEKKDDVLYTGMVHALKSTFITPMDREDIHQLVIIFDTIIDSIELITLKLQAYEIKKIDKHLIEQASSLYESFRLIKKLIFSLRKETEVEKYCKQIRNIEQMADRIYIKALHKLFSDTATTVTIIKMQDLYTAVEEMIDEVNEASLLIENIVVKYS